MFVIDASSPVVGDDIVWTNRVVVSALRNGNTITVIAQSIRTLSICTDQIPSDCVESSPTRRQVDTNLVVTEQVPPAKRPGTETAIAADDVMFGITAYGNPGTREMRDLQPPDRVCLRRHNLQASHPFARYVAAIKNYTGLTGVQGQVTLMNVGQFRHDSDCGRSVRWKDSRVESDDVTAICLHQCPAQCARAAIGCACDDNDRCR